MEKSQIADNQQGQALSYVVGLYYGDGCVTHRKFNKDGTENRCFSFQSIDEDFRDHCVKNFKIAFPDTTIYSFKNKREGKGMIYSFRAERIGTYIEKITGKRTLIPNFVYSNRENKISFIEALLDSDGWVTDTSYLNKNQISCAIGLCSTSEMSYEFKKILTDIGIKGRVALFIN